MKYSANEAENILKAEKALKTHQLSGLRCTKQFYNGLKYNPEDIKQDSPAGVVFYNLNLCYQHGKNVSEGCVEDVIWGFRQSGIPANIVVDGFTELYRLGYLNFTDPNGTMLLGTFNEKAWYQWTRKFYSLLLEGNQKQEILISDSIKPEDTTVDKLED